MRHCFAGSLFYKLHTLKELEEAIVNSIDCYNNKTPATQLVEDLWKDVLTI